MTQFSEGGGQAFPSSGKTKHGAHWANAGMSIRDYFAAKAISGVMRFGLDAQAFDPQAIAEDAYRVADAMLAARRARPQLIEELLAFVKKFHEDYEPVCDVNEETEKLVVRAKLLIDLAESAGVKS